MTFSLAKTRKKQKQEVNRKDKGTRRSKEELPNNMEEELRRTQAECVLCGLKSIDIYTIRCACKVTDLSPIV